MHFASLDGVVGPAHEVRIPATDEGLLRGDGVFEVVRVYHGRPFALPEHLERLGRSARNLRLEADVGAVRADVAALLEAAAGADCCLRIVLTRGGRRLLLTEPVTAHVERVRLACVTYGPTRVLDGIKSLSYAANMLCTRLAQERGFDEALLVTPHGRILEAPTSSIFWSTGGSLRTPPLADHILDSITRRYVIEATGASEASCTIDDLRACDEAFLASTVREVQSIGAVEDHELPPAGALTQRATAGLRERIERELAGA